VLVPVVLAALLGPVCHGQLAPPTPVERAMAYRRQFGLPSGRAYVRRVQRSGGRRDDQGFAFTWREWRHWNQRYRVEFSDMRRVHRYLARRPGLSGGLSIEDDWPRRPYLQVLVTRDPERHERALRRRYRYRLEAVAVQYPAAELRAIEEQIAADDEALTAEGFDVQSAVVEDNRVFVQMVSAHPDHQQVFTERYGPAVVTFAAPDDERTACDELDAVRVSSTGRSLVLLWTFSSGEELSHVELTEHPDRVEVGIVQRVPYFGGPNDARPGRTRVPLSQPLGDRRVIDAATGREP
jgi:hypothetical protein